MDSDDRSRPASVTSPFISVLPVLPSADRAS